MRTFLLAKKREEKKNNGGGKKLTRTGIFQFSFHQSFSAARVEVIKGSPVVWGGVEGRTSIVYLLAKEFHGANSYVKERFNVASDIRFDYFLSEEKETNLRK